MAKHALSRRSILAAGATGVAGTLVSLPGAATFRRLEPKRPVKNIIFCVSDGMSAGVPTMLDHYLQTTANKNSVWYELSRRPEAVNGFMDTRSLDSMVTDSAAAASAWGSGSHVMNGAINTLPGVGSLTPLYELLGNAGMKRGLVTTATITHATPSGFAVATRSRAAQPEIARLYLQSGVEVLLGGGHEFYAPDKRADKEDLYARYREAGYQVVQRREDLLAPSQTPKLLGIFSEGQIPFTVDRDNSPELTKTVPTLAEMSKVAIDRMKTHAGGFILQIEGARIDHAAHPNDLAGLIFDQLAFEDAVQVALDFAMADGETLVVVTSDHGNANPGISGAAGFGPNNGLALLAGMKSSYEAMAEDLKAAKTAADMQTLIEAKLGIKLKAEEAQAVVDSQNNNSPVRAFGNYRFATATLAMVLGTYTGVGWTSGQHTSDWTKLTAIGPGAEHFAGVVENVEVFRKLISFRGLTFRNPTLTLEEALKATAASRAQAMADEPHWI